MVSKIHDYLLVEDQSTDDQRPWSKYIDPEAAESFELQHTNLDPILEYRYVIPEYQRPYEWEEDQWDELWEEIEPFIHWKEPKISDVFFGSMFTAEKTNKDGYEYHEVIDGQQRLTTVHILFYAILHHIQNNDYSNAEDVAYNLNWTLYSKMEGGIKIPRLLPFHEKKIFNALVDAIPGTQKIGLVHSLSHKHPNTKNNVIRTDDLLKILDLDEHHYVRQTVKQFTEDKTKINAISQKVIEKLQDEDISPSDVNDALSDRILKGKLGLTSGETRVLECFGYFNDKIEDTLSEIEDPDVARNTLHNIMNFIKMHFWVGHFRFRNDKPSLLIRVFEVLNDRGIELKKADIINKNLVSVAHQAGKDPQDSELIETWRHILDELDAENVVEFIKTYLIVEGEATQRAGLKDSFIDVFSPTELPSSADIKSRVTNYTDAVVFIKELDDFAELYADIIDPLNRGIKLDGGTSDTRELNEILTRILGYRTSMWEPLVLGYYHAYRHENKGDLSHFKTVLETVESVVIRKYLGMDTHAKDRLFERGIQAFWSHGVSENVIQAVGDVKTEDDNYYGERLITELCRTEYKNTQARLILRKINSTIFNQTDSGVLREIVNGDVQVEHIFPQTPAENSNWFENFFKLDSLGKYPDLVRVMRNGDRDDKIDATESFIRDLGNMMLLTGEVNDKISNDVFSAKMAEISDKYDFDKLPSNDHIQDIYDQFSGSDSNDNKWNVDTLTANRTHYMKLLVQSLGIGDEFDDINDLDGAIENKSEQVTVQKLELINVNHKL